MVRMTRTPKSALWCHKFMTYGNENTVVVAGWQGNRILNYLRPRKWLYRGHKKCQSTQPIRSNSMKKVIVNVPPGRLGIHLEDFQSEKSGTIVSSISESSPLAGKIFQGDCIIGINDVNVRDMDTSGMNLNNAIASATLDSSH